MTTPRFSIIIPHYQGSINHDTFLRGINSILNQTSQDFEIICIHDGPLLTKEEFPVEVVCTQKRYNDWGHSLRDWGLKKAKGEYIIHFNPDNVLHRECLEVLSRYSDDVLIFGIKMMGLGEYTCPITGVRYRGYRTLGDIHTPPRNDITERDYSRYVTLKGELSFGEIDCLQFVAKKKLWSSIGGWFDKREQSDFVMAMAISEKCKPTYVNRVLGEHY